MSIPDKIQIRWMPDLHTAHIGQYGDSEQFLITEHLVPSLNDDSLAREYIALYCFDSSGKLTSHKIAGPLAFDTEATVDSLLSDLAGHKFGDIYVAPFQVTFDGRIFGLLPNAEQGTIQLEPGAMITFMEPWDGEYYT